MSQLILILRIISANYILLLSIKALSKYIQNIFTLQFIICIEIASALQSIYSTSIFIDSSLIC